MKSLPLFAVFAAACSADLAGSPGDVPDGPDAGPAALEPSGSELPPAPQVVVSFTFDDAWAEQLPAIRDQLAGFRATLYVNSGYVGAAGRLTWDELRALRDAGHEIGGHTTGHRDLEVLDPAEQHAQICADRVKLESEGFAPRSFAFPFGHHDAEALAVAEACGYAGARLTTGLGCPACPPAESVPPARRYEIRAYPSIDGHSLEEVQGWITAARESGGWLPLVFHHVATDGPCDVGYCWEASRLAQLAAWLREPEQQRWVRVATVTDLIASDPAAPVPLGELVTNGSFERVDRHGNADCIQRLSSQASPGTSYRRATTASEPRGAYEEIETSTYRRPHAVITKRDRGACAPFVYPGEAYELSLAYRTTARLEDVQLIVFGRSVATGAWRELERRPIGIGPGDGTWRTLAQTISIGDPDVGNLSFGLQLRGPGTLAVDDFSASPRP